MARAGISRREPSKARTLQYGRRRHLRQSEGRQGKDDLNRRRGRRTLAGQIARRCLPEFRQRCLHRHQEQDAAHQRFQALQIRILLLAHCAQQEGADAERAEAQPARQRGGLLAGISPGKSERGREMDG
jgi:hypothetical protein